MTTTFIDLPLDRSPSRPAWPRRFVGFVAARLARRRRRKDLAGLPDHILRDIGVDPADVRGVSYGMTHALILNTMR